MTSFIVFFVLTATAASLGAIFTPGPWYAALAKPALTPPNWVFPLVWTVLYVMIALAGWLLWRGRERDRLGHVAVTIWGLQLGLNAAWSWLFFGLHLIGIALTEIFLLLAAVLATIVLARRTSPTAGWLLVPYLAWAGFAAWLNYAIWRLNG